MDPALHRSERGREVGVVGRGNDDGIDILVHLVEHHPEVVEKRLSGAPVFHVLRTVIAVDIAESNEVLILTSLLIRLPSDPPARANECDVYLAVSRASRLADGE